ncbi:ribonuclease Z [Candidatus Woesearchaeota archaeon]|nr:ribonuclease Z [Candidatus Woesearchaeota archaeon]
MIQLTFLGTASMVPTKERNHVAALLTYDGENILIDCGEGTQRQLRIAEVSPTKISKILISHWHGDHVLGLPGLMYSLAACEYNDTLKIYGPKGAKEFMHHLMKGFAYKDQISYEVIEVGDGVFFENKEFKLEAKALTHTAPCLGFAFIEKDKRNIDVDYLKKNHDLSKHPILKDLQAGKDITWKGKVIKADKATRVTKGKKVSFVSDTAYCQAAVDLCKDADLVVCEATYLADLEDKAEEYRHLTASMAADIAKKAKAKRLVLTHFSQRYRSVKEIESEAKKVFKNSSCAEDFLSFEV